MPAKKMGVHEITFAESLRDTITRLRTSKYSAGEGIGGANDAWIWQPWLNTNILNPKRWLYSVGVGRDKKAHGINEKIRYFLAGIDELFEKEEANEIGRVKQQANFQDAHYRAKRLLSSLQRKYISDTERLGKDIGEKTLMIAGLRNSLIEVINAYEQNVNYVESNQTMDTRLTALTGIITDWTQGNFQHDAQQNRNMQNLDDQNLRENIGIVEQQIEERRTAMSNLNATLETTNTGMVQVLEQESRLLRGEINERQVLLPLQEEKVNQSIQGIQSGITEEIGFLNTASERIRNCHERVLETNNGIPQNQPQPNEAAVNVRQNQLLREIRVLEQKVNTTITQIQELNQRNRILSAQAVDSRRIIIERDSTIQKQREAIASIAMSMANSNFLGNHFTFFGDQNTSQLPPEEGHSLTYEPPTP